MGIIGELVEIWLNEVCDKWPGLTKEVKKYIERYDVCQRNKNYTEVPIGKLMPDTVPEKPCKGIALFPLLNHTATLQSSLSLFKYY